jgi:hypothetical protein
MPFFRRDIIRIALNLLPDPLWNDVLAENAIVSSLLI